MKKICVISIACTAALFVAAACNNAGKGSMQNADSANEAKIDSGQVSLSERETDFMVEAANGGLTEVELSRLAADKSSNQRVKDFAAMMITDHGNANSELTAFAQSKNVTLPDSLSRKSQGIKDDLAKKKGKDFDKAYMKVMLDDHQKVVSDFQSALTDIQNTELKTWVSNTLPVLQGHLDSARAINQMYGYQGNQTPTPATTPGP